MACKVMFGQPTRSHHIKSRHPRRRVEAVTRELAGALLRARHAGGEVAHEVSADLRHRASEAVDRAEEVAAAAAAAAPGAAEAARHAAAGAAHRASDTAHAAAEAAKHQAAAAQQAAAPVLHSAAESTKHAAAGAAHRASDAAHAAAEAAKHQAAAAQQAAAPVLQSLLQRTQHAAQRAVQAAAEGASAVPHAASELLHRRVCVCVSTPAPSAAQGAPVARSDTRAHPSHRLTAHHDALPAPTSAPKPNLIPSSERHGRPTCPTYHRCHHLCHHCLSSLQGGRCVP